MIALFFLVLSVRLSESATLYASNPYGDDYSPNAPHSWSSGIVVSQDGQVIENRYIVASGRGIHVSHAKNVIIKNVIILHSYGEGIFFEGADNLVIQNVEIRNIGAEAVPGGRNIYGLNSDNVSIRNATLYRGTDGIRIDNSENAEIRFLKGRDIRGTVDSENAISYGTFVQFYNVTDGYLEDFTCINDPSVSVTGDIVSIYMSSCVEVRRGLIDGNVHPSGLGIQHEYSSNCIIEDVDVLHQSAGSFGAYPGDDILFQRVRTKDNICSDQGFGESRSGGLFFVYSINANCSFPELGCDASNITILDSQWYGRDPYCTQVTPLWHQDALTFDPFASGDLIESDFDTRGSVEIDLPWHSPHFAPNACDQTVSGDFDGDGKEDLLCHDNSAPYTSWVALSKDIWFHDSGTWAEWCGARIGSGDFDGDGKTDLLCDNGTHKWAKFSNGVTFTGGIMTDQFDTRTCRYVTTGDFNGDSRDDLFCKEAAAPYENKVALSTGVGFEAPGVWSSWCGAHTGLGDFNGDGKEDLFCDNGTHKWVQLSNGTHLSGAWVSTNFNTTTCTMVEAGDFNGDGKDDLYCKESSAPYANRVALSTGSGFAAPSVWSEWCGAQIVIGDINGDGKDDIVCDNGTQKWAQQSSGGAFEGGYVLMNFP
jgi:hypothetical protein